MSALLCEDIICPTGRDMTEHCFAFTTSPIELLPADGLFGTPGRWKKEGEHVLSHHASFIAVWYPSCAAASGFDVCYTLPSLPLAYTLHLKLEHWMGSAPGLTGRAADEQLIGQTSARTPLKTLGISLYGLRCGLSA
jgi:hypothetical protein